jgi:hypothetical protein
VAPDARLCELKLEPFFFSVEHAQHLQEVRWIDNACARPPYLVGDELGLPPLFCLVESRLDAGWMRLR